MIHVRKLFFFSLLLAIGIAVNGAVSAEENEISLINSFEKDITGDGFEEYIKLEGTLLSNKSSFYQNVWLDIKGPFKNSWTISLQNGYRPDLSFINLDREQNSSIFYKVAKDSEAKSHHYQVYTLQGNKIQSIELPSDLQIQSKLKNNFKLELTISPTRKPIIIDLQQNRALYINEGIYNTDGDILKKNTPVIKAISEIKPFKINHSNVYGLKTFQHILIANTDIRIGSLETEWHYLNHKWQNKSTTFNDSV